MWSWPSTSVRYLSSASEKRTLGLRKRLNAASGLRRRRPSRSRCLSSGSIGRIFTSVPSRRKWSMRCMMQRTLHRCQYGLYYLTLVDRHVFQLAVTRVDLPRASDLLLLVVDHLEPLRDPAARARDREEHREHADRHVQRLVDQPGVEVDVRIELALDEVVVLERDLLELQRDVEQRVGARDL